MFCEKGVLSNFAKFIENICARVSFLIKLQASGKDIGALIIHLFLIFHVCSVSISFFIGFVIVLACFSPILTGILVTVKFCLVRNTTGNWTSVLHYFKEVSVMLQLYHFIFPSKLELSNLMFLKRLSRQLILICGTAISCIIFWDFPMFYQIFLSPQVKRWAIISYKHGIYASRLIERLKT